MSGNLGVMKGDHMERLVIEVDDELKKKIDVAAANQRISIKELLTPILNKNFPNKDNKNDNKAKN